MAQTPCPQPDLQLQSWGSSGVCLETEVCFRPVLFTCSLALGLELELELWGTQAEGEPKAAAESHLCLLGLLQPSGHHALPQVQQTIVCPLVFKPPNTPGPREPPHRENHVGTLPLPLLFWAVGRGTRWEPNKGQGGAIRLGQERPMHLTAPSGRIRGWLSVCVSLVCRSLTVFLLSVTVPHATAPAAWKPQVSGRPGFSPVV